MKWTNAVMKRHQQPQPQRIHVLAWFGAMFLLLGAAVYFWLLATAQRQHMRHQEILPDAAAMRIERMLAKVANEEDDTIRQLRLLMEGSLPAASFKNLSEEEQFNAFLAFVVDLLLSLMPGYGRLVPMAAISSENDALLSLGMDNFRGKHVLHGYECDVDESEEIVEDGVLCQLPSNLGTVRREQVDSLFVLDWILGNNLAANFMQREIGVHSTQSETYLVAVANTFTQCCLYNLRDNTHGLNLERACEVSPAVLHRLHLLIATTGNGNNPAQSALGKAVRKFLSRNDLPLKPMVERYSAQLQDFYLMLDSRLEEFVQAVNKDCLDREEMMDYDG